jgi:hypothetical protein
MRNVEAAGHCRLLLHDAVYELDEPRLVQPTEMAGVPRLLRRIQEYLGFEYVTLRAFRSAPGSLDETRAPDEIAVKLVGSESELAASAR